MPGVCHHIPSVKCPNCSDPITNTGGTGTFTYPNTYMYITVSPDRYGWICPRCSIVHAPWVQSCTCPAVSSYTTTVGSTDWKSNCTSTVKNPKGQVSFTNER